MGSCTVRRYILTSSLSEMIIRLPCLYSSDFTFAAEVVEVVGSPCLKESLEAHLSDVLHGIPDNPGEKGGINIQNDEGNASDKMIQNRIRVWSNPIQ